MQVFLANGFVFVSCNGAAVCLLLQPLSRFHIQRTKQKTFTYYFIKTVPSLLLSQINYSSLCCVVLFLRSFPPLSKTQKTFIFVSFVQSMAGGSIKRHCFSEEDDVEPGYSGHNHFHHYQHGFISRTLGYGTFYNRRVRSHSIFSPRSGRFYDARFEDHQPHFLQACSLCKKPLGDNRDIFMYRSVALIPSSYYTSQLLDFFNFYQS